VSITHFYADQGPKAPKLRSLEVPGGKCQIDHPADKPDEADEYEDDGHSLDACSPLEAARTNLLHMQGALSEPSARLGTTPTR
jgi:hypothetical protein